jgi:hypothetical protein
MARHPVRPLIPVLVVVPRSEVLGDALILASG